MGIKLLSINKKLLSVALALLVTGAAFAARAPKYVFLFVGDGMSVNHVNAAQMYKAALEGELGVQPLCFTQFPVVGYATTYSANNLVTDSAASATAIATGVKTSQGRVGLDAEENRLLSVAELAKSCGKKVAILSNLGVGGATPAGFYAHQKSRSSYDRIFEDLLTSGFDFFAGSTIDLTDDSPEKLEESYKDRVGRLEEAGYTFAHNAGEFASSYEAAQKMLLSPLVEEPVQLVMDSNPARLGLRDMLDCALTFLMKDGCRKGFFIMAEEDTIDGQSHGNDAASMVNEVLDFDKSIQLAYEFYLRHPKKTAIIVTADHETGGLTLKGNKPADYRLLACQKGTKIALTKKLRDQMRSQEEVVSWEQVKDMLKESLGFWDTVALEPEEEEILRKEYDKTVARRDEGHVVDPFAYADHAKIVHRAVTILDAKAGIGWASSSHTSGVVPVYAVGPRTGIFSSQNDNAMIGPKIAKIAGYGKLPADPVSK